MAYRLILSHPGSHSKAQVTAKKVSLHFSDYRELCELPRSSRRPPAIKAAGRPPWSQHVDLSPASLSSSARPNA